MARATCTAIRKGGGRCQAPAVRGTSLCWSHSPANAQALKANGRKGGKTAGRGRPTSYREDLEAMREKLKELAEKVEEGSITPQVAHALNGLFNTSVRCIETEHKIVVAEGMEARLWELEAAVEDDRRGHRA